MLLENTIQNFPLTLVIYGYVEKFSKMYFCKILVELKGNTSLISLHIFSFRQCKNLLDY